MPLNTTHILQTLMKWRVKVSASAWLVVQDSHAAEDIFQNVALKAMTREVSFESEGALLSWAFITARHEGVDWLRRQNRANRLMDGDILSLVESEWQLSATQNPGAKLGALSDCLEEAPEQARRLLKLRYFDGLSCEEIAQQFGIALAAVYKRFSRLHEGLRNCIEHKMAFQESE